MDIYDYVLTSTGWNDSTGFSQLQRKHCSGAATSKGKGQNWSARQGQIKNLLHYEIGLFCCTVHAIMCDMSVLRTSVNDEWHGIISPCTCHH